MRAYENSRSPNTNFTHMLYHDIFPTTILLQVPIIIGYYLIGSPERSCHVFGTDNLYLPTVLFKVHGSIWNVGTSFPSSHSCNSVL